MYKCMRRLLLLAAALLCLCGAAGGETARDITSGCLFNGAYGNSIRDEFYTSVWESSRRNGVHALVVEATQGQTIGGLLIRWRTRPLALRMEAQNAAGEWETIGGCEADFLAQYIPVNDLPAVRLMERETGGDIRLEISQITVLSPGELPPEIQVWQKAPDKVDLMLLAAHPDDEVLWFGGLLPTYAGELGREVLVVNASYASFDRRLELLDCLWTCGVRSYPVFLGYPDICANERSQVLQRWNWERVVGDVVALYRRYRPDVVMLHAANGESGHWAHIILSEAGREAALAAGDAQRFAQSAQCYGVWNVPKVYMHLYQGNPVRLDWHVPLERFDGRTGFEVADEGFRCHRSQLGGGWAMQLGGENDNAVFGLWRSTVGADSEAADLFEHIAPRQP